MKSFVRYTLAFLLVLGGFWITRTVMEPVTEERVVLLSDKKLEEFAQRKDSYQVIFIGTSRVYRQLSPAVFEDELARHGIEMETYNFGTPSQGLPEQLHVLRQIHELEPANLRYVIFEPDFVQMVDGNYLSFRSIKMHELGPFLNQSASIVRSEYPSKPKLLIRGILATAHHYTNFGLLSCVVKRSCGELVYDDQAPVGDRGYSPLNMDMHEYRRDEFLAGEIDVIAGNFDAMNEPDWWPNSPPMPEGNRANLERFIAGIKELGYEPILFIPPLAYRQYYHHEVRKSVETGEIDIPMLAIRGPEIDPEFYETGAWFDRGHLHRENTEVMTRKIALQFKDYLDQQTAE